MLQNGLYEQVIHQWLAQELDGAVGKIIRREVIDKAEASRILSKYMAEIIEKGLDQVIDDGGDIQEQILLSNKIVSLIKQETYAH
jgi:hypothetical protein